MCVSVYTCFCFTIQHNPSRNSAHNSFRCLQIHDQEIHVFNSTPEKEGIFFHEWRLFHTVFSQRLVCKFLLGWLGRPGVLVSFGPGTGFLQVKCFMVVFILTKCKSTQVFCWRRSKDRNILQESLLYTMSMWLILDLFQWPYVLPRRSSHPSSYLCKVCQYSFTQYIYQI